MTPRLVPKQVHLREPEQRLLQEHARRHSGTVSATVRAAVDSLPEPDDPFTESLRRRGLLVEPPQGVPLSADALRALLAKLDESLAARGADPRLSEGILEERYENDPYR